VLCYGCFRTKHKLTHSDESDKNVSADVAANDIISVDTTVFGEINVADYQFTITKEISAEVLYKHFQSKGYYIQDKLSPSDTDTLDASRLSVSFCDIVSLGNNRNYLILYWIAMPFESGHCIQPHKAILANGSKGYYITNEDFIPLTYTIDSLKEQNGNAVIISSDYDCVDREVKRKLIITLQDK
jgi:hypothetical protein